MGRQFSKKPREIQSIQTENRVIQGKLPVPDSLAYLDQIAKFQPIAVDCQPPILWDHAQGVHVFDPYGNKWLDFSSGVLVANVGHSHPQIQQAAVNEIERGNMFSYCFPSATGAILAKKIVDLAPSTLNKIFLLTTGSETTECAIKLCKTYGQSIDPNKKIIVTFINAFHGRTMGAQMAGGAPQAKKWIGTINTDFIQVPFPDGYHCKERSFHVFEKTLAEMNITPKQIAGVMMESYQGGGASFAPEEYVRKLRDFCDNHDILLVFDEVQSGFGRTGKLFAFEHYGVIPDMVCLGKGISSSLPLAAILGRSDILDQYGPGDMTSTHGGNPVSCAAAIANIDILIRENLVEKADEIGRFLFTGLKHICDKYSLFIGEVRGRGMVYGIDIIHDETKEPYADLAFQIVQECFYQGLLLFAPVGYGGATIKICPPLIINDLQVAEGLQVFEESFHRAIISLR
ncbi:aspartate aminotransferase family protein [Methanocalculus taiwanensis]|uniref:Aspartate aminotransferase family protein n=1 Tax=Methanocalculus taiwanensis TaxID=106207 RepID=A0ABD4TI88_9EURY|nr:aspartate aminotransferase family protein [Methanocalculus taiwanensis]MCQ1538196.1 aspartate aminotransferase family protein [Methanocalculus taiwanensis]